MTLGLVSLGSATDLLDATYSSFAYPPRRTVLPLIANDVGQSQLAVIQDGPKTYRQASLGFIARDTTELELVRSYEESSETVAFIDFAGNSRDVMVISFSPNLRFGDVWDVTVTLLELGEPVPPGS